MRAAAAVLLFLFAVAAFPAEPDLVLDLRLDPVKRELSARAELAGAPADFRFQPHPSLEVRETTRLASGKLRIDYGGTLPALDPKIDFRGVLKALPPMASPEGSYLPSGSGWYPQAAPLFTYRIRMQIAQGQKAVVAGTLAGERTENRTYHAVFEYPTPTDGIELMAGPYEVREKTAPLGEGRRVRLRTYFFADLAPLSDGYLQDAERYLARYDAAIGAYPFSEFSIVASPLPVGFGMPTLTYLGAAVLKLPFIRASSLGHEVLHNWWGNGVLADYARGNWAEGLTTFMADYAYKEDESREAARDMRLAWLRDLAAVPDAAQRPLVTFRSRAHAADAVTGYGKSAMLFLMLRDTIGAEAFARGIRGFWTAQRFKSASWDDLRAAFEKASGRDLRAFFRQWLERPGAPQLELVSARWKQTGLEVELQQATATYALRVPVEVDFGARTETHWVELEREKRAARLALAERPRAVRLDPELRVYRRLSGAELPPILRQWFVARSPAVLFASADRPGKGLVERLFESPYREVQQIQGEAVLIVGLHAEVDAALARLGLPPRPATLAGKGSAQVWTVRESAPPVAVVSGRDEAALAALERPLPHYGAQSWLAFEGARVLSRGAWPPAAPALEVKD